MRKLVSAVLASVVLATCTPAAALPALTYDPTQTNPYYPAWPGNPLWQQQQLNNVSSNDLKKLLLAGFLVRLFTGGNQQQPTTVGGTVQTVDAGTVAGQRTGGIVSTPGNQSRGVRIYIPPGGDQSNGLFLLTPAADPPYPLEGKPLQLRLGLTMGAGVQVVRMVVDNQSITPGATVTLEQSATAGQYRKPFTVVVRRATDGAAGVVQGYVDYSVAKFGAWASSPNGPNSETYSTPESPVGQIERNADIYVANADARSADYSASVSGKITGKTQTTSGWELTVTDDVGKTIKINTGRLPAGFDVGTDIKASGKLRRGADGRLMIDATAVTDKGAAAKAKKTGTAAMEALRAKAAQNMKKLDPVGSLADTPKPASWGTVASGSGGDGGGNGTTDNNQQSTAVPGGDSATFKRLVNNWLHAAGLDSVPVVPAEMLNEQSPGMRSARSVFSTAAAALGIVIGSLAMGLGLIPAGGIAFAASVIGLGIAGMAGDLSDIGSFIMGDGFGGYMLDNHLGQLVLEVGLGAMTGAVMPVIGRALLRMMPKSIASVFDGGATKTAKAFSERLGIAGGADNVLKAQAAEVAESIGGRAGMKIASELAAANPRLTPRHMNRLQKAAKKTLSAGSDAAAEAVAQAQATNARIASLRSAGIEFPANLAETAVPQLPRSFEAARAVNQAVRQTAQEVAAAPVGFGEKASAAAARTVVYNASAAVQGVVTGEVRHAINGGENAINQRLKNK